MKAYFASPGAPYGVALSEIPTPTPKTGEILVAVRAAALNRFDVMAAEGYRDPRLPPDGPVALGLECAGEVVEIGPDVTRWRRGDAVMGRCWGGLAQYAVMKAGLAMPKPPQLEWTSAATMHVLVIAHDAIVTRGALKSGEAVLVNALSSGIGIASVQIARLAGAGVIIGTTSSRDKTERIAGAFDARLHTIDVAGFADRVLEITNKRGVDVVSDSVGGTVLGENLRCMAIGGRLISIGRLGTIEGTLDMDLLALKRLHLIGVTNRTRTLAEQEAMVSAFVADVVPALKSGRVKPFVDRISPFEDIGSGLDLLAKNRQVGKVVVKV